MAEQARANQHGHYPEVRENHHIFAAKEAKARAALTPPDQQADE